MVVAIETSNPSASGPGEVALGEMGADGVARLIDVEPLHVGGRHDDALAPAIDRLCRRASVAPAALARVAVSAGPGGFSALRIAVTTAAMITEMTGADAVPVPSAVVAARVLRESRPDAGRIAVVLASKESTAWVTLLDPPPGGVAQGTSGVLMDDADLSASHERVPIAALVADEHLPERMRAWAVAAGVEIVPLRLTAEATLHVSAGIAPVAASALRPIYPREPEAVRKWRELGRARG